VTLADVAKRAGVSIATASYVINARTGVGPRTRENVLRIAEELGFRPNRVASGLRTGQIRVLGLVLADITNPFYPEIAGGVIAAAADAGFEVFLSHSGEGGKLDGEEVRRRCATTSALRWSSHRSSSRTARCSPRWFLATCRSSRPCGASRVSRPTSWESTIALERAGPPRTSSV